MRAIQGARCPYCGGPLTYEVIDLVIVENHKVGQVPPVGELSMCVRCVWLVLCRGTIAIHGDLGDRPQSFNFPGHDERIRAHQERLRRMGLVDNDEDEDGDEGLAAVPA
jgi:hypothetical protein